MSRKMDRKQIIQELRERNIAFTKIRFYKKSPYQKRRYKPKYVGWEVWIYSSNMPTGYVITQEDYEKNKEFIFEGLDKRR